MSNAIPTYSINNAGAGPAQSIGVPAGPSEIPVSNLAVPDTSQDGYSSATVGGQQLVMQTGDIMLVKGPDGAYHWYQIDAERWIPGQNPPLRFYGP